MYAPTMSEVTVAAQDMIAGVVLAARWWLAAPPEEQATDRVGPTPDVALAWACDPFRRTLHTKARSRRQFCRSV